jgi:membrane protease YdiL (CAAX protease family)
LPAILDHVYFAVVAIVQPILGYLTFRKLLQFAAGGRRIDLSHLYHRTLVGQWLMFATLAVLWIGHGRSAAELGFFLRIDGGFGLGLAVAMAALFVLALQLRRLNPDNPVIRDSVRKRLGKVEIILPRSSTELKRFYGVAVTAGIVEETLWRGFMFWYLGQYLPVWATVVVSSIGFGLAHTYQGFANVPKASLAGATFAVIYLLSGSLWIPMVLHAAADMVQGRAVQRFYAAQRQAARSATSS